MMDYINKSIISLVLVTGVALSCFTPTVYAVPDDLRLVKVISFLGEVKIYKSGGERSFTPYKGMPLAEGDSFVTGKDASIRIKIDNDKDIKAGSNTELVLNRISQASPVNAITRLNLLYGNIFTDVSKTLTKKAKFQVKTPKSILNIRGTVFYVSVTDEENNCDVLAGKVEVLCPDLNSQTEEKAGPTPYNVEVGDRLIIPASAETTDEIKKVDLTTDILDETERTQIVSGDSKRIAPAVVDEANKPTPILAMRPKEVIQDNETPLAPLVIHITQQFINQPFIPTPSINPNFTPAPIDINAADMPSPTETIFTPTKLITPTIAPTATNTPTHSPTPTQTITPTNTLPPTSTQTPKPVRVFDNWEFYSAAYYDEAQNQFVLTDAKQQQVGVIWYKNQLELPYTAEFEYKVGGGENTGGDGFCFMFCKDKNYFPNTARSLGFSDGKNEAKGYGIEFDSYKNSFENKNIDKTDNHIALIKDSEAFEPLDTADNFTKVEDNKWHSARIEVNHSYVHVFVDDKAVLYYTGSIDDANKNIGFSASTGSATNNHLIKNIKFSRTTEKTGALIHPIPIPTPRPESINAASSSSSPDAKPFHTANSLYYGGICYDDKKKIINYIRICYCSSSHYNTIHIS